MTLGFAFLVATTFAPPASAKAPPPPARAYDWCSEVVVRPDGRYREDGSSCAPVWRDEEIASGAGIVLMGSYDDVSDPHFAHPANSSCGWPTSHGDNARYVTKLRKLRGDGPPLRIVHMHRFDVVPDSLASLPGFRAEFLLPTDRPWSEVEAFFANDRAPVCGAEGCRWSHAYGAWEDRGKGTWLRDAIADARIVLLERRPYPNQAGYDAFVADLERAGVQTAWIDAGCGYLRP